MDHHADVEAQGEAPSYHLSRGYWLWYQRGSADFIPLGVHRTPPPAAMEPFVESRQIPEAFPDLLLTGEERLLKLGFEALDAMERLGVPTGWPLS